MEKAVIYWIMGSAGVCPKCGNHNAMLDKVRFSGGEHWDGTKRRFEDLECRDCGHYLKEGEYINVTCENDRHYKRCLVGKMVENVFLSKRNGAELANALMRDFDQAYDWANSSGPCTAGRIFNYLFT